jgi:ATP-dependent DNA helicase RecG
MTAWFYGRPQWHPDAGSHGPMVDDDWIDQSLSAELRSLCAKGEGQTLEFKETIPNNAQDLCKGIAAFASSNGGRILVGVTRSGDLVGLRNADQPETRDSLTLRVSNLCRSAVAPQIALSIKFAVERFRVVMVIDVPKGTEPVYYYNGKPYVRDLAESRPATPDEVIERVKKFLINSGEAFTSQNDELKLVAVHLADVIIYTTELDDRCFDPWLSGVQRIFGYAAENFRHNASDPTMEARRITVRLLRCADACDSAAAHHHTIGGGSWEEFCKLAQEAADHAQSLLQDFWDKLGFSLNSDHAKQELRRSVTRLVEITSRAEHMISRGQVTKLRGEVAREGLAVLRLLTMYAPPFAEERRDRLAAAARELHVLETERVMLDGGAGEQRTLDVLCRCVAVLGEAKGVPGS